MNAHNQHVMNQLSDLASRVATFNRSDPGQLPEIREHLEVMRANADNGDDDGDRAFNHRFSDTLLQCVTCFEHDTPNVPELLQSVAALDKEAVTRIRAGA